MTRGSVRTMILSGALFFAACEMTGSESVDPEVTPSVGGASVDDAGAIGPSGGHTHDGDTHDTVTGDDRGTGTNTGSGSGAGSDSGSDTGSGTGSGSGSGTGSGSGSGSGGGTGGNPRTGPRVGTNFWFLADWGEQAFKSGVDFATTTDPWNPAFIQDLKDANFAVYRFMDWGGTNWSPVRDWSERTTKASAENAIQGSYLGRGIAYEWMFDLCNRMHTDCWITVPHLSIESYEANPSNNFYTELAKLAKENLDPSLNLYIEYSNETWNGGFSQYHYAGQRGAALFAQDEYQGGHLFHVYASTRMYEAFLAEYGDEIGRVKWVLAGQHGNVWSTSLLLIGLDDERVNPNHHKPSCVAIGSYVGLEADGASPDIANQWRASLASGVELAKEHKKLLDARGIELISYEGGQHILTNADVFARSPIAYDLYLEWLEQITPIYSLVAHYAHSGGWSSGNAWGSKEYAGQPLSETPKARALVDFIKSH